MYPINKLESVYMATARIRLTGKDPKELDDICSQIKDTASKLGVNVKGPVPLPTKKIVIPVMKTPCGSGTGHGNATWDRWEMRIHKRVIDIGESDRALRQIMRIPIPQSVKIEIEVKG